MHKIKELFKLMLSATIKCRAIAESITSVADIKKTLVFENLVSNLLLIKDIESKIDNKVKEEFDIINREKFENYDHLIISDYYKLDENVLYKIIKEELPFLQNKLEKIIFS